MIKRIESIYDVGDKVVIDKDVQIGHPIVFSDYWVEWAEMRNI